MEIANHVLFSEGHKHTQFYLKMQREKNGFSLDTERLSALWIHPAVGFDSYNFNNSSLFLPKKSQKCIGRPCGGKENICQNPDAAIG